MIYVLSDIHGQKRRFDSIMKQINLQPEDTLYILGDVIDRNPYGIQILRQIMKMPNVKMILGNHELMMLDALYYQHDGYEFDPQFRQKQYLSRWYHNGGDITHRYLKRIRKDIRTEVFEFLDHLPLNEEVSVGEKKYILTHAAPLKIFEEMRLRTSFDEEKMFAVWHRFQGWEENPCEETVIFGHTPTYHFQRACCPMDIWYGKGLIGIDCGASYPEGEDPWSGRRGRLACLRLDDMKEFYSEEKEVEDGEIEDI